MGNKLQLCMCKDDIEPTLCLYEQCEFRTSIGFLCVLQVKDLLIPLSCTISITENEKKNTENGFHIHLTTEAVISCTVCLRFHHNFKLPAASDYEVRYY